MHIVIIAPGSRGDVQPYIALGKGLKAAGHTVRLVTGQNYEMLVKSHGLDFWPVEVDVQEIIQSEKMREALEKGSLLASMAQMAKAMKQSAIRLAERSMQACAGMDLTIAGMGGIFFALSIAEKTGLPFLQAYNVPLTPTRAFPGALLPRLPSRLSGALNRLSHHITQQIVWQAYRPADKTVRQQVFGLPATSFMGPFQSDRLRHAPILYGFSPAVIAPPPDWDASLILVTGYWFLEPSNEWSPPADLMRFMETGSPPVYIGFGSMSNRKPEETADIVLRALKRVNRRAIVYSGWGSIHKADLQDSVFMVDSIPHTWLFPRVEAVVHHGGAGTTAAGIRAGVPSIVIPHHGDQPFWGQRIAKLGVGPAPVPRSKLNPDRLAQAIQMALDDTTMRQRAADLGVRIRAEDGINKAVKWIAETFS